ncbi:conjugal transfer protein TraN [Thermodesulfovibrio yellowstonii]|uniref:conjugal transfer protein TraN n=1 Tax=Thermodesulfovibrio yellowstonii TaxID=28262 RepID=UPI00040A7515|nr:conjugal transfer protein TraN [Thermodesulfovibrio islandicus]
MLKVFAFALSLIFVFVTNILAQDSQTQGQDAARQNWESVRAKAGSPDALKQHFVNPLLGGGLLSTIDNSKSGNVQIACPSSKEFLTVVIQPKGTGDFSAQIYWDRDLNGQMDSSLTVPNVSGVCADGFISCDPGTWNHCKDYQFVYSNGDLTLKEVALTDLSGCFCVNSSCGSNLVWNNLTLALKTFGGAVAGAMQQADPRFAISDARIDGAAIYFYGQKARDCTVASGGTGSLNPEQYYNSPFRIQSDTEIQVISQQQDPTSFYNLMLAPIKNMNIQTVQCSIKRVVTCSIQTAGCSITMSGNGWWHQDEQLMQLVGEGNKIGVYTEGVKTGEIIFPYGVTVTGVISSGTNNCGMSFWGEGNTLKASGEKGGGTLYFSGGVTVSGSLWMSLNNGRGYVWVENNNSLRFYEDRFGSGGYIYFGAYTCPLGNYPCSGNPPTCTAGRSCVTHSSTTTKYQCSLNGNLYDTQDQCTTSCYSGCPAGGSFNPSTGKCEATATCQTGELQTQGCFTGYGCPLGNYQCQQVNSQWMCSPYQCITQNDLQDEGDPLPAGLEDDGAKDDQGNCLGTIYIFNGKSMRCRKSGVQTGFHNCCNESQGKLYDSTGSFGGALGAIPDLARVISFVYTWTNVMGKFADVVSKAGGWIYGAYNPAESSMKFIGVMDNSVSTASDLGQTGMNLMMSKGEYVRTLEDGTVIWRAKGDPSQLTGQVGADWIKNSGMAPAIVSLATSLLIKDPVLSAAVNLAAQAALWALGYQSMSLFGVALPVPPAFVMALIQLAMALFMKRCDKQDIQTSTFRESGYCHEVGEYCVKKWPLVGCVQKAISHCCFNSKLARIIHEQGRPQLNSFGPGGGWGDPKSPNCRGLLPEEFQAMDFNKIDLSEYLEDIQRNIRQNVEQQIQDTFQKSLQDRGM